MGFRKLYSLDMGFTDMYCLDMGCRDKVQTTTAHLQAVPYFYSPCPVCSSSFQPMSSLYPIFRAHVQRGLHLYSTNTYGTLYLQHKYCLCLVSSVHHLSCPCPLSTPYLLLISSQYTIFTVHVLVRAPYLLYIFNFCQSPVITPYHLPMPSL